MNTTVFVVMLAMGLYEDRTTKVVKAFSKQEEANAFVSSKNCAIAALNSLHHAVECFLADWDNSHPCPCPPYPKPGYPLPEYDLWASARTAEEKRLEAILGIEKAYQDLGMNRYDSDDARYYIVPTELIQ